MKTLSLAIQRSIEANPIREPMMCAILKSLNLPTGSFGLDAGCGIGLQARLLAEAVGPDGRIAGVDLDSQAMAYAKQQTASYLDRISFYRSDVRNLPFRAKTFDWVWSADCIGYPLAELTPYLCELKRVIKTGGRIILLAWSSQQLLPGYPLLEARLNAYCSSYGPYLKNGNPGDHFLRAIEWFQEAGLEDVRAQSFIGEVQAPIKSGERTALTSLFDMLWGEPQPGEFPEDREEYRRLCQPGSAEFILDIPGYYAFFTYTIFVGVVRR